jgi:hypothetical protein
MATVITPDVVSSAAVIVIWYVPTGVPPEPPPEQPAKIPANAIPASEVANANLRRQARFAARADSHAIKSSIPNTPASAGQNFRKSGEIRFPRPPIGGAAVFDSVVTSIVSGAPAAVGVIEVGANEHTELLGTPVQLSVSGTLNPFSAITGILYCAVKPPVTVAIVGVIGPYA